MHLVVLRRYVLDREVLILASCDYHLDEVVDDVAGAREPIDILSKTITLS